MSDKPVLPEALRAETSLSSGPIFGKDRKPIGIRLAGVASPEQGRTVSELMAAAAQVAPSGPQLILVAPFGMRYDDALLAMRPPRSAVLEVPAQALGDDLIADMVPRLADRGYRLALRGWTDSAAEASILKHFEVAVIDSATDRRGREPTSGGARSMKWVAVAPATVVAAQEHFARGALGVAGWPHQDPAQPVDTGRAVKPSQAVVLKLLSLVNQYADPDELEQALKLDPSLAFKLLKFINSPAFALTQNVKSFGQAIMLLGYKRMMRWLALLMASSVETADGLPAMHTSVRRGLLMECFANGNADLKDALFITGAFSLLDRILSTDLQTAFAAVSLPDEIVSAITRREGPLAGYLRLAELVESGDASAVRAQQGVLGITTAACNDALVHAIWVADQIEKGGA